MSSPARSRRRVYPRACGGTRVVLHGAVSSSGLSPRLRGNRRVQLPCGKVLGSIPAPAGEPGSLAESKGGAKVYPRACGGTAIRTATTRRLAGLSPRLRGVPSVAIGHGRRPRIIPASAGCARSTSWTRTACRGDPRGLGACFPLLRHFSRHVGSSPAVRGGRFRFGTQCCGAGGFSWC